MNVGNTRSRTTNKYHVQDQIQDITYRSSRVTKITVQLKEGILNIKDVGVY